MRSSKFYFLHLSQVLFLLRFAWKLAETAQHRSQFRINVSWFRLLDDLGVGFNKVPLLNMILHAVVLEGGEENHFARVSPFPACDGADPVHFLSPN